MSVLFSVLVPVYNVEKYVAECIESVLKQEYSLFELLLVDDGSTDKSGLICDEYAARDNRIRVFHKPNQGLIHTRRYAIERAKGDYYIFLDSDDMLKHNALNVIDGIISQYKCDCVIYGYERTDIGRVISQTEDITEEYLTDKKDIYRKCFFSTDMNSLCRKTVKATVFHDYDYHQYYKIQMSEDLLQSLEIYKNSSSIYFSNEKLYLYRVNPNSITQRNKETNIDYTVREKVLHFIEEEQAFSEDDYNKYRDFCIKIFINEIVCICQDNDTKTIHKLCKLMRDQEYYQKFIKTGITNYKYIGSKSIIFCLFKNEHDRILSCFVKSVLGVKNGLTSILRK